jgi:hypothetical protein
VTRWTHNGQPVGPTPRPWRLTRAQRVEMEAALSVLGCHGRVVLRAVRLDGLKESVLRARLAIALRAALRADEDARCEEADRRFADSEAETLREMCEWPEMRRAGRYERKTLDEVAELPPSTWRWAAGSQDDSARWAGGGLYAVVIEETIPLALWERADECDCGRNGSTVHRGVCVMCEWQNREPERAQ